YLSPAYRCRRSTLVQLAATPQRIERRTAASRHPEMPRGPHRGVALLLPMGRGACGGARQTPHAVMDREVIRSGSPAERGAARRWRVLDRRRRMGEGNASGGSWGDGFGKGGLERLGGWHAQPGEAA